MFADGYHYIKLEGYFVISIDYNMLAVWTKTRLELCKSQFSVTILLDRRLACDQQSVATAIFCSQPPGPTHSLLLVKQ